MRGAAYTLKAFCSTGNRTWAWMESERALRRRYKLTTKPDDPAGSVKLAETLENVIKSTYSELHADTRRGDFERDLVSETFYTKRLRTYAF